ncbi:MAG: filamentous hemagglutinin N-terminal domain-containing protein [Methylacidiphilales bacterium]|nr:filamentous hemagglutinin N-terminal domain-containing protein [Candidatus Methylacidiphilales bacterium]
MLGDKINGGAIRDRNLFHSFGEFNVNDGQRVYFSNPSGVLNILTRVTGGNASSILGTLGVDGNANLFLMNPNGIFFGKNASLDVRSSFVGTTANGLQFGNQGVFSATNPQVAPLLTVNPSALVFSQVQANAGITNLSQAPAGIDLTGQNITGLRVPDGKNLLMIGGDINIDGGAIRSYGGRIELASLAAPGAVELNNTFSLSIPNDIKRGNIFLTNGAEVNVRGADAGNIFINAQNLNIAEQSKIRAGIDIGLGTSQAKAGDININSTGTTTLSNDSFLANVPQRTSIGKGGNINITTGLLELLSGSVLNANIFGQGDGGNINITAGSVSLTDGASVNARNFGRGNVGNISIQAQNAVSLNNTANILSNVESGGIGKGGNINITASSLDIKNGSQIQAGIRGTDIQNNLPGGRGSAGNINIDVGGAIAISGIKDGFAAAIFGDVEAGAEGNGGNINIKAGSFYLLGSGSFLNTNTAGKGNSGNIFVQAANLVSLDNSGIFSDVDATGVGNAGSIEIKTGSLSLTNGAELNTKTFGQGNSGSIRINARDGIILEGKSATSDVRSRIISAVNPEAVGNAGDIELTTGNLAIGNEAFISSSTLGKGNAANIIINARNISIGRLSTIQSSIFPGGVGKGGNIQVDTDTLSLTNGGQINTNVLGIGDAGNITINARNSVNIDGVQGSAISGIQSQLLTGTGKGGDIQITTGSFSAKNGASVNASTNAQGDAGNVTINASDTVTFAGFIGNEKDLSTNISTVTSDDSTGKGGDIRVSAKGLFLQSGAFSAQTALDKETQVISLLILAIALLLMV